MLRHGGRKVVFYKILSVKSVVIVQCSKNTWFTITMALMPIYKTPKNEQYNGRLNIDSGRLLGYYISRIFVTIIENDSS